MKEGKFLSQTIEYNEIIRERLNMVPVKEKRLWLHKSYRKNLVKAGLIYAKEALINENN